VSFRERGQSGDRAVSGERRDTVLPTLHPYLDRRQTLVIFAFIVVGFVLLAYRTELATDEAQRGIYEACLARAEISRLTGTLPGPNCEGLR